MRAPFQPRLKVCFFPPYFFPRHRVPALLLPAPQRSRLISPCAFHRFPPPSSRHFSLYICRLGRHWHITSKLISATSSLSHGFHRTHSNLPAGGGALRLELPLPARLHRPCRLVPERRRSAGPSCPSRYGASGGHHEPLLPDRKSVV